MRESAKMESPFLGSPSTVKAIEFFLDTTFQIDNWAPVYFPTDVQMFTEELVLNSLHFNTVWF